MRTQAVEESRWVYYFVNNLHGAALAWVQNLEIAAAEGRTPFPWNWVDFAKLLQSTF